MPSRLQHKKLRVEYVDIKRLKKWQNNPRTMPDDQAAALQANLKEFDFADPLVIDQNNRVVGGHQRLDAAIALGYKQVPCVRRHLTERQFKTLNLALNKISGEWDNEKLAGILDELSKTADIALTGFSDQEVNMIIEGIQKDADSTELEDKVPPLPTKAQTKPGQLWKLGPHRLLCGDATDPAS